MEPVARAAHRRHKLWRGWDHRHRVPAKCSALQGLRQEDIARRLSLSAKTVNTHKSRLFTKLQIQDSIALARMASQYGVMAPDQTV